MTKSNRQQDDDVSRFEWIVAALGALGFIFIIGYFGREAARGDATPPMVTVRVDSITASASGFTAHFEARNTGGSPASAIQLHAELREEQRLIEASQVRIDYLAAGSMSRGGFFFSRDPRAATLTARATGFLEP